MKRRLRRRSHLHEPGEINITAFMNLMVILVPFLLITAVFSRITTLELNLPAAGSDQAPDEDQFELEIIVRENSIEVGDRDGGLIKRIAAAETGHDFSQLSDLLQQVKARFPEKLDATLLLEADIPYDTMVQVMDSMRVVRVVQAGSVQLAELFPEIAIGDAPASSINVTSEKGQ
ncbi:MAG TPA: biopolymer transporter ExbD [Gammaproteobacteria bacterium]|nr:biopolymer transporter ExbD [Gammaproteobacteria bacterium]